MSGEACHFFIWHSLTSIIPLGLANGSRYRQQLRANRFIGWKFSLRFSHFDGAGTAVSVYAVLGSRQR
jgi:hypothetical protein